MSFFRGLEKNMYKEIMVRQSKSKSKKDRKSKIREVSMFTEVDKNMYKCDPGIMLQSRGKKRYKHKEVFNVMKYDNKTRGPSSWNMYRMVAHGVDIDVLMWYWVGMPHNVRECYDVMAMRAKCVVHFDYNYEGDDYMDMNVYLK
jgi:hypothetical protein